MLEECLVAVTEKIWQYVFAKFLSSFSVNTAHSYSIILTKHLISKVIAMLAVVILDNIHPIPRFHIDLKATDISQHFSQSDAIEIVR